MNRLIAFDLDDTLYKERDFVDSAFCHIADQLHTRYSIDRYAMLAALSVPGKNPFDSLTEYLHSQSIEIEEDIPWMVQTYRTHFPRLSLDASTWDVLNRLQNEGIRMAIITDGRAETQINKVLALRLDSLIPRHLVSISEEIGADKSVPEPFQRMMRLNPDIGEFIYVGDNPEKDFLWPNRLGWRTIQLIDDGRNVHPQDIAFTSADQMPQHRINSLSELFGLLRARRFESSL